MGDWNSPGNASNTAIRDYTGGGSLILAWRSHLIRLPGERYAAVMDMTTREHSMNIADTSVLLGELLVRSITLAAGVALVILVLAALFSSSI
jgi:hypothetical protein